MDAYMDLMHEWCGDDWYHDEHVWKDPDSREKLYCPGIEVDPDFIMT